VICEFKEKQYEQPLNNELAWKGQVYIPGQVLENDIAIDAAIFSKNPKFWNLWNNRAMMKWKSGLRLRREFWDLAEETLKSDLFPKFKFNLFIQHKRPEHVSSRRGKEYPHWKRPYLRYDINEHQQIILHKLEQKTSSHAIVVYVCPAFWKRKELWMFINGKLVENSNFVKPSKLHGHQRYTFVRGGKDGHACSEPIKVEGLDILSEISRMRERSIEFENNVQFLNRLAMDIKMTIKELDETTREGFFAIERTFEYSQHELGTSVMTILAFNLFANTTWGIGYTIKEVNPRIQGVIDSPK